MITADKWISLSEQQPNHGAMVLISDGREIGMAIADTKLIATKTWWAGCGFSGYEWDWDFEPTHWLPLEIELPPL